MNIDVICSPLILFQELFNYSIRWFGEYKTGDDMMWNVHTDVENIILSGAGNEYARENEI